MRKEKAAWVLIDDTESTDQCGDVAVLVLNRQSQERDVFPLKLQRKPVLSEILSFHSWPLSKYHFNT